MLFLSKVNILFFITNDIFFQKKKVVLFSLQLQSDPKPSETHFFFLWFPIITLKLIITTVVIQLKLYRQEKFMILKTP